MLDQLAARYFVTDPKSVPFGQVEAPTDAVTTASIRSGFSGTAALPAAPLRAVVLSVRSSSQLHGSLDFVDVTLRDEHGKVLTRGERRITAADVSPRFFVPLAADTLPPAAQHWQAEIRLRGATGDHLDLGATHPGVPAIGVVRPQKDGLSVAFTDAGAVVWQRLHALPRIRWASNTITQPDPARRLADLAYGVSPKTVVLDQPGPTPSGAAAKVRVTRDTDDAIDVAVNARGAGYVVLADALQDGWNATIDGRAASLRPADNGLVAVYVPAGQHVVALHAQPPGWHLGIAISLASLIVLLSLLVVALRRRRRPSALSSEP